MLPRGSALRSALEVFRCLAVPRLTHSCSLHSGFLQNQTSKTQNPKPKILAVTSAELPIFAVSLRELHGKRSILRNGKHSEAARGPVYELSCSVQKLCRVAAELQRRHASSTQQQINASQLGSACFQQPGNPMAYAVAAEDTHLVASLHPGHGVQMCCDLCALCALPALQELREPRS